MPLIIFFILQPILGICHDSQRWRHSVCITYISLWSSLFRSLLLDSHFDVELVFQKKYSQYAESKADVHHIVIPFCFPLNWFNAYSKSIIIYWNAQISANFILNKLLREKLKLQEKFKRQRESDFCLGEFRSIYHNLGHEPSWIIF